MNVNLNKLRNDFNGALSDMPEERLKELFHELYYQAYYHWYITGDEKAYQETINLLKTLVKETEPRIRYQATIDALIEIPHNIFREIQEQNHENSNDLIINHISCIESRGEIDKALVRYIDNCKEGDENDCLEYIKRNLQEINEETDELLKQHDQKTNGKLMKDLEDEKQYKEKTDY